MTSNIGTEEIRSSDNKKRMEEKIKERLRQYFRPEFLNRIDEIVIFNSLSKNDMLKIVDIQLETVKQRLKQQGLDILVDDKAKEFLVENGFNPDFGARPLKRLIQKSIVDPLALGILKGEFKSNDKIKVSVDDNELVFSKIV
jgi:ATP-dependent Clp protease ATP-binding subunit ClpB